MDWIESHTTMRHHPKTKRVARDLGIPAAAVVGHLHCLWHWATKFAFDGYLGEFDVEEIFEAAGFDDYAPEAFQHSPQVVVQTLTRRDWIDETERGLYLHDWHEYVQKYAETKESQSKKGSYGNHIKWHVNRGEVSPDCIHCRSTSQGDSPESPGESHGESSSSHKQTPPTTPTRQHTTEPDGGGVDKSKIETADRTCLDVAEALGDEFVMTELEAPLRVLKQRLIAGETITSPVGYVRSRALRERQAVASRGGVYELCDHCDESVLKSLMPQHLETHDRAREAVGS